MESRGPEDSKNVKTSQAYFFERFISFFEDFSLSKILIKPCIYKTQPGVLYFFSFNALPVCIFM